jgi:hypothetical protein
MGRSAVASHVNARVRLSRQGETSSRTAPAVARPMAMNRSKAAEVLSAMERMPQIAVGLPAS